MLQLEVLPVAHGDSLVVTYGKGSARHRILIDGGPVNSYRRGLRAYLEHLTQKQRHFELLVVSHIDADHIDGILVLLQDEALGVTFDEVWFNGWRQLTANDATKRGATQGEFLTDLLKDHSWNAAFDGGPVRRGRDQKVELPGGAELTVLSPHYPQLQNLEKSWKKALQDAGYEAGKSEKIAADLMAGHRYRPPVTSVSRGDRKIGGDRAAANGSSIALLLDYQDRRLLLGADAHAAVLAEGLRQVCDLEGTSRVDVDIFKLAHHGSAGNISPDVLGLVNCSHFVVSTNGDVFHHPDTATIELIGSTVPNRPMVSFNYLSDTTKPWKSAAAQQAAGIRSHYPEGEWLTLQL